jgi:membrane-associated phospholipid phosphatase
LFLPALTGKWRDARAFVIGNLAAFAIGIPMFALLPAIGPWYGYNFAGTWAQMYCQTDLLLLRSSGPHSAQLAGVVCFPSFHVIWAILCARALWGFRYLRIPISILSGMIILSTMTTGWHYFSDVVAGAVVATLSIAAAQWVNSKTAYEMGAEIENGPPEMVDGIVRETEKV